MLNLKKKALALGLLCLLLSGCILNCRDRIDASKVKADVPENYVPMTAQVVEKNIPIPKRQKGLIKVTALCYHEVGATNEKDYLSITAEEFRTHIQEYKKAGYTFINIDDLKAMYDGQKKVPKNPLLLTFDDGYANNWTHALPILEAEGVTATVFVITSMIADPDKMTKDEVKELSRHGIAIGSHTVSHKDLAKMTPEEVDYEFKESKKQLETIIGKPVNGIAFPLGHANATVLKIAQKYYPLAFFADVEPKREETRWSYNRYGVFQWNGNINSIFQQPQPK